MRIPPRVRRSARVAGYAVAVVSIAWTLAVLASPDARRGYVLWATARSLDSHAAERATTSVSVDRMPTLCLGGPCPGRPINVVVTLPAAALRNRANADSAWILVGPVVYAVRLEHAEELSRWSGRSWTRLEPSGFPAGVLVRVREPGGPSRVLRFAGVRIESAW